MTVAQPTPTRSLVGAVLSRKWRLVQKLGEGGMGEVYAADPVGGGARVALKILRPEYLGEVQILARFLEEGRMCVRLIHPNIVRVFECTQAEDGSPYLVMELLEGVPLGAYTANGGRVPAQQAVPIVQGILAGLAAAHAKGIVHRDLKPDNVFLTRDRDGTFVVKLLDFGVAKVMDVAGGMGNRTRTGMLLGTPAYMSPEQVKNAREVDPRADVWSAGVLFYEMLTGRTAFPAPTDFARLTAVMTAEPEPVERIDPALAPLGPIIARALKKNRDDRFASALEMARALSAAAYPIGAMPASRLPDGPHPVVVSSGVQATTPGTMGSPADAVDARRHRSGDTLESAPAVALVQSSPPQVVVVEPAPLSDTLPSKDLPIFGRGRFRRGVPPAIVVGLVALALAAGFLLGWALARMS
jgi:serine/threonine-protein kinase